MMRRYFPLWFPILFIAVVSAVNYQFWHVETTGMPINTLAPQTLSGHAMKLSHPSKLTAHGTWVVHASALAIKDLGGLEIARTIGDFEPKENDWLRVPSGGINDAFTVTFVAEALSYGASTQQRIWLRAGQETIVWDVPTQGSTTSKGAK